VNRKLGRSALSRSCSGERARLRVKIGPVPRQGLVSPQQRRPPNSPAEDIRMLVDPAHGPAWSSDTPTRVSLGGREPRPSPKGTPRNIRRFLTTIPRRQHPLTRSPPFRQVCWGRTRVPEVSTQVWSILANLVHLPSQPQPSRDSIGQTTWRRPPGDRGTSRLRHKRTRSPATTRAGPGLDWPGRIGGRQDLSTRELAIGRGQALKHIPPSRDQRRLATTHRKAHSPP
jgi:hypothetical protein